MVINNYISDKMADQNNNEAIAIEQFDKKTSRKKVKIEYLERWENDEFKTLDNEGSELAFFSDIPNENDGTIKKATKELLARFARTTESWKFSSIHHSKAALLVALYLDTGINWDFRSDITATRVLATLYNNEMRAHKEGIFYYDNGGWKKVEELPELIMNGLEQVFNIAQLYFSLLSENNTEKVWSAVFYILKSFEDKSLPKTNLE